MKCSEEMVKRLLERKARYETEKKQKTKKTRRLFTKICCVCLAVGLFFGTWQVVLHYNRNGDNWAGGAEIGKLWSRKNISGGKFAFVRLTPANILISLNITSSDERNDTEKDIGAVMFGQYLATLYAFDYEAHFKMFPKSLVENEFVSLVAKHGLSYDSALKNIKETSETLVPYSDFDISYNVEKISVYEKGTEDFEEQFEYYDEWFEEADVKISKISEVRVYYFNDIEIVIDGTYTQKGDPGIGLDEGFMFYCIGGKWYYWPGYIDNDLSVDLALANDVKPGYFDQDEISGKIEAIEGDYISLGGKKRYYAPELVKNYKVGDEVTIYYYDGLGMEIKTEAGRLTMHSVINIKPYQGKTE